MIKRRTTPKKRRPPGTNWAKEITYRGVKYRSSWEVFIAKLLLYSDIYYQYEPQRFYLATGVTYLPDFYLPTLNMYIEVKGWLRVKDSHKMVLFRAKVTSKLLYLGEKEIEDIYGAKPSELSKLDYEKFVPTREQVAKFQSYINKTR